MEKQFNSIHRRAISQLKPHNLEQDDFIHIHRFKPMECSNKISINIKVPKVRLDTRNLKKPKQNSQSPLKNLVKLIKQPSSPKDFSLPPTIYKKNSVSKTEKPKDYLKLIVFPGKGMEKTIMSTKKIGTQDNLPPISRQKVQKEGSNSVSHSIYFELLAFFIKKYLDYGPIYKKIDTEKKGFIDKYDIKNYFYSVSANCNIEELAENLLFLGKIINNEPVMAKNTFLALCSAVEYDVPFTFRSFIGENAEKLNSRILNLNTIFKEFADKNIINRKYLLSLCGQPDRETKKALDLVTSEQIDFSRFLICLPFFMWLQVITSKE